MYDMGVMSESFVSESALSYLRATGNMGGETFFRLTGYTLELDLESLAAQPQSRHPPHREDESEDRDEEDTMLLAALQLSRDDSNSKETAVRRSKFFGRCLLLQTPYIVWEVSI